MNTSDNAALRLLEWYAAMGVDEATGDEPCDWFSLPPAVAPAAVDRPEPPPQASGGTPPRARAVGAPPGAPAPSAPPRPSRAAPPAPTDPRRQPASAARPAPPDPAVIAAREEARAAASLDAVKAALARFDGCPLKKTARTLCFARGNPAARLMIVGEAPGADEDATGRPFVGRAGQLLDKMLAAIGLDETGVYITNVVYWRPPGNRPPTPQEAQTCQPFLERQIELAAPDVLLLVGGSAAKQIFGTTEGILRLRGQWRVCTFGSRRIRCLATLHPAYLLRNPAAKRLAWRDLLAVRAALDEPSSC